MHYMDMLSDEYLDYIESLSACGCDYSTKEEYTRSKLQEQMDLDAELGILES